MTDRTCEQPGCTRKHAARGMCNLHWRQWRKTTAPACAIEGCENPSTARGWCNNHYLRWHKHGDPTAGNPAPRVQRAVDHADGTRTCLDCGEAKSLEDFPRDPAATAGRRSNCKPCHAARSTAWYQANKDDHLLRAKQRYQRDIEVIRQRDIARYRRDKVKRIELVVEAGHRRRATLRKVKSDRGITVRCLAQRDGDHCRYCACPMTFAPATGRAFIPNKATIEHVVALSRGGTHTWDNVALACWQCNVRKNATEEQAWLAETRAPTPKQ